LKGLLTRDGERRWGAGEVSQWLGGSRDVRVYYEGDVEQERKRDYRPYKFGGKEYWEAKELGVALAEKWEDGVKHFGRGFITDWVKGELGDQELASQLLDITEDEELDGDQKLSAALLVMNQELPLMWKGEVLTRDWVAANPDKTIELCKGKLPTLLKDDRREKWLVEFLVVFREIGVDEGLEDETYKSEILKLVLNPELPFMFEGQEVTKEWVIQNTGDAVGLIKSSVPGWLSRLKGENWLEEIKTELNQERDKYLPKVREIDPEINQEKVDQLLLQPVEDVIQKVVGLVEKLNERNINQHKVPEISNLLKKQSLTLEEGIALLVCDQSKFEVQVNRNEIWKDVLLKSPPKVEGHRTMSQFESFLGSAAGVDRQTIKLFFSGLETRISDTTRGLITIPHWGSLGIKIKTRKATMGRSPATGEMVHIPSKKFVKGYLLFAFREGQRFLSLRHPRGGSFQEKYYGESAIEHQSYEWCSHVSVEKTNLKKLSLKRRLVVEICRETGVDLRLSARLLDEFLCHLAKVIDCGEIFVWKRVGRFGSKQKNIGRNPATGESSSYIQSYFTVSAQMKQRLALGKFGKT
jgi:nucleoid DNA-binding protein